MLISACPDVDVTHLVLKKEGERALALSKLYDFTEKPKKNHLTGNVESHNVNHGVFNEQYHKYKTFGYVLDPDGKISLIVENREGKPTHH